MLENKLNSSRNVWENCWEKQHAHFDIIGWGRKVYNFFIFNFLEKFISKQTDFLELGCGTASLGIKLASHIRSYTGFDIAANVLKQAEEDFKKRCLNNFVLERKDIFNLENNKKYDVVWSQGLVEHFEATEKLIEIHLDLCKEGGVVIISVPAKYSYHHLWYLVTRFKSLNRFWPWSNQIFISKKDFRRCLGLLANQYQGYQITNTRPYFLGLTVLVINK